MPHVHSAPERFFEAALSLTVACTLALALFLVLAPASAASVFEAMFARVLADAPPGSAVGQAYLQFTYGVLGAVLFGWALTLALLLRGPFRAREPFAWWAFCIPLAGWFVLDTGHSIAAGFHENALLNGASALAYAIPLLALRKRFTGGA
jgi:hypothetical protein